MKIYKAVFTHPAVTDLESIADYISIELQEPDIAKRMVTRIKESVLGLSNMPKGHPLILDKRLALQGIRKLVVDSFLVFYRVSDQDCTVTVIRVLSNRRNWNNLL
jgi:addiction module RelE/StbE family toxin